MQRSRPSSYCDVDYEINQAGTLEVLTRGAFLNNVEDPSTATRQIIVEKISALMIILHEAGRVPQTSSNADRKARSSAHDLSVGD